MVPYWMPARRLCRKQSFHRSVACDEPGNVQTSLFNKFWTQMNIMPKIINA
jgi:hypothetical protein